MELSKNQQTWNKFWDELCSSEWGKTKNAYIPSRAVQKVMNRYLIKDKPIKVIKK